MKEKLLLALIATLIFALGTALKKASIFGGVPVEWGEATHYVVISVLFFLVVIILLILFES